MQQDSKVQMQTTNEHVVDQQPAQQSPQIERPSKANTSFHFALSNVTEKIIDTSGLVHNNNISHEEIIPVMKEIYSEIIKQIDQTRKVEQFFKGRFSSLLFFLFDFGLFFFLFIFFCLAALLYIFFPFF